VRARECSSFDEYLKVLEGDANELAEVFELLTTKETYFFRQDYQLRAFADELLPRIREKGGAEGRLTIWCAGCSSGEEAYTIGMLVLESALFRGWAVRVIGTDLCRSNIDSAMNAVYRPTSFRSTTAEQKEKYFDQVEGGFKVNRDLRRMMHFSVGNLMNPSDVRSVGRVDVIFCRNVLIYFGDDARRVVTDLFFERLLPGGYLLLGHSESLLNAETAFEPLHLEQDLVYRRPVPPRPTRNERGRAS
jgi:chemotaxis protein methyltransferase CheR